MCTTCITADYLTEMGRCTFNYKLSTTLIKLRKINIKTFS